MVIYAYKYIYIYICILYYIQYNLYNSSCNGSSSSSNSTIVTGGDGGRWRRYGELFFAFSNSTWIIIIYTCEKNIPTSRQVPFTHGSYPLEKSQYARTTSTTSLVTPDTPSPDRISNYYKILIFSRDSGGLIFRLLLSSNFFFVYPRDCGEQHTR